MEASLTGRHAAGGATDAGPRDPYVDLLRVVSMLVVVVLHWLATMPTLVDGVWRDVSVVDVQTSLWPVSWIGDVMAVFFFVGGYANWVSWRGSLARGEPRGAFLVRRYRRLLAPTLAFLGLWLAIDLLALVLGHRELSPLQHVTVRSTAPFGPLWFIGVYLVVVALVPLTVRAHERWRGRAVVAMVLAVVLADLAAVALDSGAPLVLNLVLVWLVPHQLGYFYADGTWARLGARPAVLMAVGGLAAVALLTSLPVYPRSLVTTTWHVLGMAAPMLPQLASGFWLVGLALLLRPPALGLLAREQVRVALARANRLTMPVFLWHTTAYLVAVSALAALGAPALWGTVPDAAWWWQRPLVLLASAVVLAAILVAVRGVASVRRRAVTARRGRRPSPAAR